MGEPRLTEQMRAWLSTVLASGIDAGSTVIGSGIRSTGTDLVSAVTLDVEFRP